MITVEDTDLFFKKCTCCGNDVDTKKIIIGDSYRTESFVLCKECREKLYKRLKMSLSNQIVTR